MQAVRGKIIVAEDSLCNMQVIKQQLEELGLKDQCEFVYSGEELVLTASKLISAQEKIDFILTDFMMPRLNGIQAVEKIKYFIQNLRNNGKTVEEPQFVFLTAYKTSTFEQHCKKLSITKIYEKPLALEQLQAILC